MENPPTKPWAGFGLVRTGGVRTANRANLGSHPDAKKAPRSLLPHWFLARKDPLISGLLPLPSPLSRR